ncbi:MAG: hypothetical protein QM786_16655 [Breznakibacter sp.]
MKKATFARWLVPAALLALTGLGIFAQPRHEKTAHGELAGYFSAHMAPELKPLRLEFEKNLTETERADILQMRDQLKAIAKRRKDAGLNAAVANMTDHELTDEQVDLIAETRKQALNVMIRAMGIANDHEPELDGYMARLTQAGTWKKEIVQLVAKRHAPRMFVLNPVLAKNLMRLVPVDLVSNTLFVLWDPNASLSFLEI